MESTHALNPRMSQATKNDSLFSQNGEAITSNSGKTGLVREMLQDLKWRGPRSPLETYALLATVMSIFLVIWVFILPGSWMLGVFSWHKPLLSSVASMDPQFVPPHTVLKWELYPVVRFTHSLPAGLWAALLPLQLSPTLRARKLALHRWLGRLFFLAAASMSFGVAVILYRNIGSEHHDYPSVPLNHSQSLLWMEPSPLIRGQLILTWAERLFTCWFCATALLSLSAARAGRITAHQRWLYRHMALGLSSAVQRVLNPSIHGAVAVGSWLTTGEVLDTTTPAYQKAIYCDSNNFSFLLAAVVGEHLVSLLNAAKMSKVAKADAAAMRPKIS